MTSPLLWTLLCLQIAMGAFDMLFHHEFTERLAWRATAARELALHAVRNAFYALIFIVLAWTEPRGALALVLLAVLLAEVVITLWDFVEEDISRRLPATERVLHTLLALNYGAILALFLPELIGWSRMPLALPSVSHGTGSLLLTGAAAGVGLFAVRDWLASRRAGRFTTEPAAPLVAALVGRRRVLVTGATGFVGERLVAALVAAGHDVVALVRSPAKASSLSTPITLVDDLSHIPADTRIDAIVNLAGAPVADWPWTRTNSFRILHSRIKTARRLRALIARLEHRPSVFIQASAIGWYGARGETAATETAEPGAGFAARVCRAVETEALRAAGPGVRVVNLRIGLVIDRAGGVLVRMLPAFDLCVGGPIGHGRQWMSWIGRDDLVRLIATAIADARFEGAVNATAPEPVTGKAFAHALGRALGRPVLFAVPAPLLRFAGGQMADEMLLSGQRVLPAMALAAGFVFRHATLDAALTATLGAAAAQSAGRIAVGRVEPDAVAHRK